MEQTILDIIYFALFFLVILLAACVVFVRNTVYCALSLVGTMLCLAGIFLIIHAPFVALIQVLVYAGAIMVLFLYVIMLLNLRREEPIIEIVVARRAAAALLMMFFILPVFVFWAAGKPSSGASRYGLEAFSIDTIATLLLTEYLLPFELTSVLLLVAIVGAILIARRS